MAWNIPKPMYIVLTDSLNLFSYRGMLAIWASKEFSIFHLQYLLKQWSSCLKVCWYFLSLHLLSCMWKILENVWLITGWLYLLLVLVFILFSSFYFNVISFITQRTGIHFKFLHSWLKKSARLKWRREKWKTNVESFCIENADECFFGLKIRFGLAN